MRNIEIPLQNLLHYEYTGKFVAPDANWQHELFRLADYELIVMTEGTLYLTYNKEDFIVSTGEYLLLPPSDGWRQGFRKSQCAFYWMHFTLPEQSSQTPMISIPQSRKLPKPEKMVVLMKQLQDAVRANYPAISLNAMTTSVVAELYGQLGDLETGHSKEMSQKQFFSDVMDYIHLNQSQNIKAKEVAAHFGYNEKYLSHLFSTNLDISLKQYILQSKIDAANYLLTDTNKPICDIAQSLGFQDSNNFSRTYKHVTGLTPSQYRDTFHKRLLFDK